MRKLIVFLSMITICLCLSSCLNPLVLFKPRKESPSTKTSEAPFEPAVTTNGYSAVSYPPGAYTTRAVPDEQKEFESLLQLMKEAPYEVNGKSYTLTGWISFSTFSQSKTHGKNIYFYHTKMDRDLGDTYRCGGAFLLDTSNLKNDIKLFLNAKLTISGVLEVSVDGNNSIKATIKCNKFEVAE